MVKSKNNQKEIEIRELISQINEEERLQRNLINSVKNSCPRPSVQDINHPLIRPNEMEEYGINKKVINNVRKICQNIETSYIIQILPSNKRGSRINIFQTSGQFVGNLKNCSMETLYYVLKEAKSVGNGERSTEYLEGSEYIPVADESFRTSIKKEFKKIALEEFSHFSMSKEKEGRGGKLKYWIIEHKEPSYRNNINLDAIDKLMEGVGSKASDKNFDNSREL